MRQFSFLEDSDSDDEEDAAAPTAAPPGGAGSSSSHAAQGAADAAAAPGAPTAADDAGTARQAEEAEQASGAALSSAPAPQRFQRLGGEAVPLTFRLLFDDAQFHAMCASGAAGQSQHPVQPVLCGDPVRCRGPFDAIGSRSTELFTGVQLATPHDAVAFVPGSAAAAGDAGARCTVPVAPEWTLSCLLRTPLATPRLGTSAVLSLAAAAGPDAECHVQVPLAPDP